MWLERLAGVRGERDECDHRGEDDIAQFSLDVHIIAELDSSGCCQAMKTAMLTDRTGQRARSAGFIVFGGSVLRSGESAGDPEGWAAVKAGHLARAAEIARSV